MRSTLSGLAFVAVLTAGTAAATTIQINLNVGATGMQSGSQSVSLSIGGTPIASQYGSSGVYQATVDRPDGWYDITIDYTSSFGQNGLTFFAYGGWAPLVDLRSLDGSGNTINGLTGTYYTLGGTQITTNYGEGPIHDTGGTAPWSGTYGSFTFSPTATFEEILTGQIYIGSDPNPPLGQITTSGETGGTSDTGDVPEPAGWWLMGAALPLIAVSKLRLTRAKTSKAKE